MSSTLVLALSCAYFAAVGIASGVVLGPLYRLFKNICDLPAFMQVVNDCAARRDFDRLASLCRHLGPNCLVALVTLRMLETATEDEASLDQPLAATAQACKRQRFQLATSGWRSNLLWLVGLVIPGATALLFGWNNLSVFVPMVLTFVITAWQALRHTMRFGVVMSYLMMLSSYLELIRRTIFDARRQA